MPRGIWSGTSAMPALRHQTPAIHRCASTRPQSLARVAICSTPQPRAFVLRSVSSAAAPRSAAESKAASPPNPTNVRPSPFSLYSSSPACLHHGLATRAALLDIESRLYSSLSSLRSVQSARNSAIRPASNTGDPPSRERILLHSQASPSLYVLPLLVLGAAAATYALLWPGDDKKIPAAVYFDELDDDDMEALPGRPGNLTPEQDEALRRFWTLFLQTCGVFPDESGLETESQPASNTGTDSADAAGEKKKKRGLSLFKKKKDKDAEKAAQADDAIKADDPNDKWGETKAYHETLAKHTPEQIRNTIWSMVKHDHPDALLLRFLRARKWDEHKALVMLMSCMNWRASEAHVDDDIMVNGDAYAVANEASSNTELKQASTDFLSQMRLAKTYIHGVDKSGRPISIAHARLHKAGEQSQESLERYTVYLIETSRLMLTPPADTGCVMFDMTGFSLANMDYAPVKFMIQCFEANYPESLGVVLIHKSPWVFQGVWKIIKGWLDPVVASKVHFTNSAKDLEEFIPKERIPKDLDGPEDWSFKYVEPVPGENDKMKDTVTRDKLLQERETLYKDFETQTVSWIQEADVEKRKALFSERNGLAKKLRQQYWQLDPYIRARSFYDRIGVIRGDGTVDHYPADKSIPPVPVSNGAVGQDTSADDVD